MIKFFKTIEELKKEILERNKELDLEQILRIDLPFVESQEGFTIMSIPAFGPEKLGNIVFISDKEILVHTTVNTKKIEKKFEDLMKKKNGESTITLFMLLKAILKNYSQEFLRLRDVLNSLEIDPVLDTIEETGRHLRRLTDTMEGLFQVVIELKEDDLKCFDVSLIELDYELFSTENKYWLDRCRSHNYRISSLRTKSEMRSNRELNDTMKKMTVIMTFLTIISIVVNVPGTIGAIFGIPALSDAYFESHTTLLVITLILTTLVSIFLGVFYWRSLRLKSN
jgi:hypothetical protein